MKIVSGFYVYKAYTTYKAHFSSSNTDISKYNYQLFNVPYDRFVNVKGKQFYDKIAKILQTEEEVIHLFIAAFLHDPELWIGTIANDLHKYIDMKKELQSKYANMPYIFAKDCTFLLKEGMKFTPEMGEFCFNALMKSAIEIETFLILRKIFGLKVDNSSTYDYIYGVRFKKYELLFRVNENKYKSILQEVIMQLRS